MQETTEPDFAPRPNRTRQFIGLLIAAAVIVLGVAIPSPYAVEKPGPVLNTLGEITIDGETQPVITVDGQDPNSDATLNLLTVSVVGSPDNRLGWFELLPALFDRTQQILPLADMFPEGVTAEDREAANKALMNNSQTTSVVAALHALGESVDTQVTVAEVVPDSAADGLFVEGDELQAIDGEPVTGAAMVQQRVAETTSGTSLQFLVVRDGSDEHITVTPEWVAEQQRSLLGVVMETDYEYAHDIDFDVDRIGGPSAGLSFSLAVMELMSETSIVGELTVSATGTIDDSGAVGAIGGLPQKLWAADRAESDVMLMPASNCDDVPRNAPKELEIVAVHTLDEAVEAIEAFQNTGQTQGLAQCETPTAQDSPIS